MSLPSFTPLAWSAALLVGFLVHPASAQSPRAVAPPVFRPEGTVLVDGIWVQPSARVTWSDLLRFERRDSGMTIVVEPRGDAAGPLRGQRLAVLSIGGPDHVFIVTQRGQEFVGEGAYRSATRRLVAARVRPRGGVDPDTLPLSLRSLEITPQRVIVVGRGRVRDGGVQVTLTLDERDGSPSATSLVVRPINSDVSETLLSGDCAAFYREHPVEARLFAEPLLRTLNNDASPLRLLAGDVYALFPGIEASPDATKRLRDRLPALSSSVPRERESASRALEQAGDDLVLAAMRLPRVGLSPEAVARLDAFVASRTLHDPEWLSSRGDDLPLLIDCLEFPDPRVRSAAVERIARQVDRSVELPDPRSAPESSAAVARLRVELLVPRGAGRGEPTTRDLPSWRHE